MSKAVDSKLILEKYGEGAYYVLHNGSRIGVVVGGNKHYVGEVGGKTIGCFKTRQKAAIAVKENAVMSLC